MPESSVVESAFVQLLELAGDVVVWINQDRYIYDINQNAINLTGYHPSKLLHKNFLDIVSAEDLPKVREYFGRLDAGDNFHGVFRMTRKDGRVADVLCFGVRQGSGNFQLLIRDITGKQQRERDLQRHHREAVALFEIGRAITSSFDINRVLHTIVSNTFWVLECQFAGVGLFGSSRNSVTWEPVLGKKTRFYGQTVLNPGKGFAGAIVTSPEPIVLHGLTDDPAQSDDDFQFFKAEGLSSVIGVPLKERDDVLGVLVGGYREPHVITENDVRLVSNLAAQATLALENARLYTATLDHSKSLKALSTRLERIQEEERARLAHDLHEGIGQVLSGIRMQIESLKQETSETGAKQIDRLNSLIIETQEEIKQLAFDLRPSVLDDFGLAEAVRQYTRRFSDRTPRIKVSYDATDNVGRFEPMVEGTLYRVVQEALANVALHSGAERVTIRLARQASVLLLDVIDNGIGFHVDSALERSHAKPKIGLFSMRERIKSLKGTIDIRSTVGKGSHIHIEIPQKSL